MSGKNWMEEQWEKKIMVKENTESLLYTHGAAVKTAKPKSHWLLRMLITFNHSGDG